MKKLSLLVILAIVVCSFNNTNNPIGLQIGEVAPDFTAKNQDNKDITLSNLLKSGSVVLLFYRSEWCPYCNKQLKAFEDSLELIRSKGASIVAVSPENHENIIKTINKTKATYNLVSDEDAKIMTHYKVRFELDEPTTKKYKGYGIDLLEKNGSSGNSLPVPATYVINTEGKITYRYFDVNYKNRVSVREILKQL